MTKRQRKKPVKKLSEKERLAWLASIASCARTARVSRQASAERWGGAPPQEHFDGAGYPTSTISSLDEWRKRTDV